MKDLPLGRTAALVSEFAVKDLPLGRTHWWLSYVYVCVYVCIRVCVCVQNYINLIYYSNIVDISRPIVVLLYVCSLHVLAKCYHLHNISSVTDMKNSSGKALGYGLNGPGSIPDVGGVKIFLRSLVSRLVLGSTQPPIKWVPGNFTGSKGGRA